MIPKILLKGKFFCKQNIFKNKIKVKIFILKNLNWAWSRPQMKRKCLTPSKRIFKIIRPTTSSRGNKRVSKTKIPKNHHKSQKINEKSTLLVQRIWEKDSCTTKRIRTPKSSSKYNKIDPTSQSSKNSKTLWNKPKISVTKNSHQKLDVCCFQLDLNLPK